MLLGDSEYLEIQTRKDLWSNLEDGGLEDFAQGNEFDGAKILRTKSRFSRG